LFTSFKVAASLLFAPFGANLRYWVLNRDRELACLLWTSPAWKMRAPDEWIGCRQSHATLVR
jgi:hypothetical protein